MYYKIDILYIRETACNDKYYRKYKGLENVTRPNAIVMYRPAFDAFCFRFRD